MNLETMLRQSLGIESADQEFHIDADDIIINGENTIDSELEEIAEESEEVMHAESKLEDIEHAEVALESLITNLEIQLARGTLNRNVASMANVSLESISNQFHIPSEYLTFGLEDGTDPEHEAEGVLERSKSMLGNLKGKAKELASKVSTGVARIIGTMSAVAEKLMAKATQMKESLSSKAFKEGPVKIAGKNMNYLTVNGSFNNAESYIKDLNNSVDHITSVHNAYGGIDGLKAIKDIVLGITQSNGNNAYKSGIKIFNALKSKTNHKETDNEGVTTHYSEPVLGGACLQVEQADAQTVDGYMASLQLALERFNNKERGGDYQMANSGGSNKITKISNKKAIKQVAYATGIAVGAMTIGRFALINNALPLGLSEVAKALMVSLVGIPLPAVAAVIILAAAGVYKFSSGTIPVDEITKNITEVSARDLLNGTSREDIVALTSNLYYNRNIKLLKRIKNRVTGGQVQALNKNQAIKVLDTVIKTSTMIRDYSKSNKERNKTLESISSAQRQHAELKDSFVHSVFAGTHNFTLSILNTTLSFEKDLLKELISINKSALAYVDASTMAAA